MNGVSDVHGPVQARSAVLLGRLENDRVRVLEYRDKPGDKTSLHSHPDMVIIPLTTFQRRLTVNGKTHELEKVAHDAGWVPAQEHIGENIGTTESHSLFVELKEPAH